MESASAWTENKQQRTIEARTGTIVFIEPDPEDGPVKPSLARDVQVRMAPDIRASRLPEVGPSIMRYLK
jgi:hypothetical protein